MAPFASGASLNLSTGLNAAGTVITTDHGCDAHWVQTVGPTLACAGGATAGPAEVVLSTDTDWYSGWPADNGTSDWITADASRTQNGDPLPSYQITFFLTSTAGASLTGLWSSDDGSAINLNGVTLASHGSCCEYNGPVSDSTASTSTWAPTFSRSR